MCFSAGASFGASAAIGIISVACFAKATAPAQRIWACIPLFFSIQQALEGALWLSLTIPAYKQLYLPGMYGFLFFALVVWPAMIPIVAYAPELDIKRKKILKLFLWLGAAVAAFHLYGLLSYKVDATSEPHHIRYIQQYPATWLKISGIIYFITAVPPLFFSSLKHVRWFGFALVASYLLSRIFYQNNIVSVWCYFAAVLSGIVVLIIIRMNKPKSGVALT